MCVLVKACIVVNMKITIVVCFTEINILASIYNELLYLRMQTFRLCLMLVDEPPLTI